eukprot:766651-Hanusia_phi.AAC.1
MGALFVLSILRIKLLLVESTPPLLTPPESLISMVMLRTAWRSGSTRNDRQPEERKGALTFRATVQASEHVWQYCEGEGRGSEEVIQAQLDAAEVHGREALEHLDVRNEDVVGLIPLKPLTLLQGIAERILAVERAGGGVGGG